MSDTSEEWERCDAPTSEAGPVSGAGPRVALGARRLSADGDELKLVDVESGAEVRWSWPVDVCALCATSVGVVVFDDDLLATLLELPEGRPVAVLAGKCVGGADVVVRAEPAHDGEGSSYDLYAVVPRGFEWGTRWRGPDCIEHVLSDDVLYIRTDDGWLRRGGVLAAAARGRARAEQRAAAAGSGRLTVERVPWLPPLLQWVPSPEQREEWPDARLLATEHGAFGLADAGGSTSVLWVAGAEVREVGDLSDARFALSDDGARVLLSGSADGVFELDLASGRYAQIAETLEVYGVAYAPDGYFALVAEPADERDDFGPELRRAVWHADGAVRWQSELAELRSIASLRGGTLLLVEGNDGVTAFHRVAAGSVAPIGSVAAPMYRAFVHGGEEWLLGHWLPAGAVAHRLHGDGDVVELVSDPELPEPEPAERAGWGIAEW